MEHFETVWTKAEDFAKLHYNNNISIIIAKIKSDLDLMSSLHDQNERIECFGRVLLDLCFISNELNINVYAALKNRLEELKMQTFDPPEENA